MGRKYPEELNTPAADDAYRLKDSALFRGNAVLELDSGSASPPVCRARGTRHIERFATQSQLIDRFSMLTGMPALPAESGASAFFREFREYMKSDNNVVPSDLIAIPVDPTDFLAFPSAGDELRLALLTGCASGTAITLAQLTERYGLSPELLDRPIRTLSGGERALVTLAKAEALEPRYSGLVMASPATWLHDSRRHLIAQVYDHFESRGKHTYMLLLQGDWPEIDNSKKEYDKPMEFGSISWRLRVEGVAITFAAATFPHHTSERTIRYRHQGTTLDLASPTLIHGENGIGKSSLALLLAGVLAPAEGHTEVFTSGNAGTARLMLQDTLRQMFGMSSVDHVYTVYRYDQERRKSAEAVLDEMDCEMRTSLAEFAAAIATLDQSGRPSSLLHDKLTLAVERLIGRPNLLVLDEPLWGLGDTLGREFIRLVAREAHKRRVPIAIISHEVRALEHLYNSRLHLEATEGGEVLVSAHVL